MIPGKNVDEAAQRARLAQFQAERQAYLDQLRAAYLAGAERPPEPPPLGTPRDLPPGTPLPPVAKGRTPVVRPTLPPAPWGFTYETRPGRAPRLIEVPAAERTSDPMDASKPMQYLDGIIAYDRTRPHLFSPAMRESETINDGQLVGLGAFLMLVAVIVVVWVF